MIRGHRDDAHLIYMVRHRRLTWSFNMNVQQVFCIKLAGDLFPQYATDRHTRTCMHRCEYELYYYHEPKAGEWQVTAGWFKKAYTIAYPDDPTESKFSYNLTIKITDDRD